MTGSAIEKDSTSRQNDFSEWTHLSVPYIICVTPYCATQIYTEQINQFPTKYCPRTSLIYFYQLQIEQPCGRVYHRLFLFIKKKIKKK